jgi:beta-glucosidase
VVATGVPTVVVLIHGRPLAVTWIAEHVPAIVDGWYLGQETGTALARVLFGDVNPGAKLPVTVPRSAGQLPMFYNLKPSARRGYLRLDRTTMAASESATVSVDVVNTGGREGDEVVQLYVRDAISSVTRPVQELKGFERLTLAPGVRRTVSFAVGPEQLRFFDRAMERVVEPGEFEILVGTSSAEVQSVTLTVTE